MRNLYCSVQISNPPTHYLATFLIAQIKNRFLGEFYNQYLAVFVVCVVEMLQTMLSREKVVGREGSRGTIIKRELKWDK